MIAIRTELHPFRVPNFVQPKDQARKRQDGFQPVAGIPLGDLDDDTLADLCNKFREDVFARAEEQRILKAM